MSINKPHVIDCCATLDRELPTIPGTQPTCQFAEWNIGHSKYADLSLEPLLAGRTFRFAARNEGRITRALLNYETPVARFNRDWTKEQRSGDAMALGVQIFEIREALPGVPVMVYGPRPFWGDRDDLRDGVIDRMARYLKFNEPDAWLLNAYITKAEHYRNARTLMAQTDQRIEQARECLKVIGSDAKLVVITSPRCYWREPVSLTLAKRSLMVDHAGLVRRRRISEEIRKRGLAETVWYERRDAERVREGFDVHLPKESKR